MSKPLLPLSLLLAAGLIGCTPSLQSGTLPSLSSIVSSRVASADLLDANGIVTGTAEFSAAGGGAEIRITVSGLKPGLHGMHIHTNPSCAASKDASGNTVTFGGAGGHFDPANSGHHASPTAPNTEGHGGDLPMLNVAADGTAKVDFYTPKVSLSGDTSVIGRSIIIHAGMDDYETNPAGNSGARERCGVIQAPQ